MVKQEKDIRFKYITKIHKEFIVLLLMTLNIIILSGLFYLMPGNADMCYHHTLESGNMGMNGVYLEVVNRRNFVYVSSLIAILSTPFQLVRLFSYSLFIFSVLLYFHSIKTWHEYLY